MTVWFVTMEAWDGDSDYDVFETSVQAMELFRALRDDEDWAGVWRGLRVFSSDVTDAEIADYEATTGEFWCFWDDENFERAVRVARWDAPTCEYEGPYGGCCDKREASVMIDGWVWELCEAHAQMVGDENVWAVEA